VLLRPLLLVPHLVVALALLIAEVFACIASWVMIVATGRLADSWWRFTRDVTGYVLRVEAYALLVHDQVPSFAIFNDVRAPELAAAGHGSGEGGGR
jgi:hypothetical protein